MQVISIDIKTTGLDPERNQILQIKALAFDLADEKEPSSDQCPTIDICIKHNQYYGTAYALAKSIDIISMQTSVDESEVSALLQAWLDYNKINKLYVMAGQNLNRPFLKKYISSMHIRSLDPGTLYTRVSDSAPPNLVACCKRAGVPIPQNATEAVAKCVWKYFHSK